MLPQHLVARLAEARRTAKQGDLQQAARLYNSVVGEQPDAAEVWLELTQLLIQAGQTALATECCRVWRLRSTGAPAALARGHYALACHHYDCGRIEDGIALFATSAEIDPAFLAAWRSLASAYLAQERAAEALAPARRGLALAPNDREFQFLLAFALADTGDRAAARTMAEALVAAEPRNPRFHYFLEGLLLRADEGAAILRQSDRFHGLVRAETEAAAAQGSFDALRALERYFLSQSDAANGWAAYARLAAHPDFVASERSATFTAARHRDAGELIVPPGAENLPALRRQFAAPALAGRAKPLVMLLLVRDEADIIRDNIAFHLNHGVDFVIVTDNGSVDGTRDLLADMERDLPVQVLDEPSHSYQQDLWTTRMAYLAADCHRAQWIFSADADEFWCPDEGDLPAAIAADAAHYGPDTTLLLVPPCMMVPDRAAAAAPDFRPIATRRLFRQPLGNADAVGRWATSWPLHRQMPKMMFRADGFVALWPGNHYAIMERAHYGLSRHLLIHHFHFRSFAHLRRKIAMTHDAMKDNPQWTDVAHDLARKLALDRAGALEADYDRATWPSDLFRAAASAGRLVETDRILATADRAPRRRRPDDGDAAALAQSGRRYIEAITPLVPRFRTVTVGQGAKR